jgi:hypothetical protein
VGKPEGRRSLGRPRSRWEGGIRMYLRKIGWVGIERIHLAYDRDRWWSLVNTVMNLRVLEPRSRLVGYHCGNIKVDLRTRWELDGTGLGSCPVASMNSRDLPPVNYFLTHSLRGIRTLTFITVLTGTCHRALS